MGNISLIRKVTDIIHRIGVPANIKGHDYLRTGLVLAIENENITHKMTVDLYPAVAKAHNTTSNRVERAMRHAIESAWERGDPEIQARIFRNTVSERKGNPTNSQFIAMISDYIRLEDARNGS